jgi:hypothetical protein
MPEYMIERDEKGVPVKAVEGGGVWTNNFYDLPVLIGDVLIKFLDDNIAPELYDSMNKVASKYTQEASEKSLIEIYQEFINNRIKLFESALVPPAEPVQQTPEIKSIDPQVQKNNLNI